jgi:hypothetical protein
METVRTSVQVLQDIAQFVPDVFVEAVGRHQGGAGPGVTVVHREVDAIPPLRLFPPATHLAVDDGGRHRPERLTAGVSASGGGASSLSTSSTSSSSLAAGSARFLSAPFPSDLDLLVKCRTFAVAWSSFCFVFPALIHLRVHRDGPRVNSECLREWGRTTDEGGKTRAGRDGGEIGSVLGVAGVHRHLAGILGYQDRAGRLISRHLYLVLGDEVKELGSVVGVLGSVVD